MQDGAVRYKMPGGLRTLLRPAIVAAFGTHAVTIVATTAAAVATAAVAIAIGTATTTASAVTQPSTCSSARRTRSERDNHCAR